MYTDLHSEPPHSLGMVIVGDKKDKASPIHLCLLHALWMSKGLKLRGAPFPSHEGIYS